MEDRIYLVFWDENAADTYLYGSEITFHKNRLVEYENHRMASGTVIRTWFSQTNYQAKRLEPQLPILQEGKRYEVRAFLKCNTSKTILLQINYYSRQDELLQVDTFESVEVGGSGCFCNYITCPERTDHWELRLVQTGSEAIWFHHFEIRQIETNSSEDGVETKVQHWAAKSLRRMTEDGEIHNEEFTKTTLNILLPDLSKRMYCYPDRRELWGIPNLIAAPTTYVTAAELMEEIPREWLNRKEYERFRTKRLIACGRASEDAARYLHYRENVDICILEKPWDLYNIELN